VSSFYLHLGRADPKLGRFRDMTAPGSVLSPAETELFYSGLYLHEVCPSAFYHPTQYLRHVPQVFARAFGQRVGQRADMPARDWRSRKDAELEFLDVYTTPELSALRAVRLLAADVQEWVARAASYRDFGCTPLSSSSRFPSANARVIPQRASLRTA
jgi:hypothetical protein